MNGELLVRIEAALAARPDIDGRLVEIWRDAAHRYGVDSGPARGALLDLVRGAWVDPIIHVRSVEACSHQRWLVSTSLGEAKPKPTRTNPDASRVSEVEALVVALESAPEHKDVST